MIQEPKLEDSLSQLYPHGIQILTAKDLEPRHLARGSKFVSISTGSNISKSSSTGGLCWASEMSQTPLSPPDFGNEQYKEMLGSYDESNSNVGSSVGPTPICARGSAGATLTSFPQDNGGGITMVLLSLLRKAPL